jgi:hypothetical protein
MNGSSKKWGFITVGLVAALSLGAIGAAATRTTAAATTASAAATTASAAATTAAAATATATADAECTPDGEHARRGGHGRGGGDLAEALADLTNTDASDIMAQRASGTSFAAIAQAKGISTQALLAEATRLETAELDAAVTAGRLTDAERTQILAGLQAHLQEELTETHALPGDGDHPGRGFERNGGGAGQNGANSAAGSATSGTALTL